MCVKLQFDNSKFFCMQPLCKEMIYLLITFKDINLREETI
jgi:hypothetical protein